MRRFSIYTTILILFMASSVLAQNEEGVYFQEDFSNGLNGMEGNGAWTVGGLHGELWFQTFVYSHPNGYDSYEPLENASPLYQNHLPIYFYVFLDDSLFVDSETRDNGFMMIDMDRYNSTRTIPFEEGFHTQVEPIDAYLISPPIDLTGIENPTVAFDQVSRFCCGLNSTSELEISADGTTWTSFNVYDIFDFGPPGDIVRVRAVLDIGDVFEPGENLEAVQLRFKLGGYSHYFWMIDDVWVGEAELVQDELISGLVQLSGSCVSTNINIYFYEAGTSNQIYAGNLETDENGVFSLANIPPGVYDIYVNPDQYLQNAYYDIEISAGQTQLELGAFIPSDINNDNTVNILDASGLNLSFGLSEGDEGFNQTADINCDGEINITDASFINLSFGFSGVALPE